jgi:hypothetical protein
MMALAIAEAIKHVDYASIPTFVMVIIYAFMAEQSLTVRCGRHVLLQLPDLMDNAVRIKNRGTPGAIVAKGDAQTRLLNLTAARDKTQEGETR